MAKLTEKLNNLLDGIFQIGKLLLQGGQYDLFKILKKLDAVI